MNITFSFIMLLCGVVNISLIITALSKTNLQGNRRINYAFSAICGSNLACTVSYVVILLLNNAKLNNALSIITSLALIVCIIFNIYLFTEAAFTNKMVGKVIFFFFLLFAVFIVILSSTVQGQVVRNATQGNLNYQTGKGYKIVHTVFKTLALMYVIAIATLLLRRSMKSKKRNVSAGLSWYLTICLVQVIVVVIIPTITDVYLPLAPILQFFSCISLYMTFIKPKDNSFSIYSISSFIYNNMDVPILVFDKDEKLSYMNKCAENFLFTNEESAKGKKLKDYFVIPDDNLDNIHELNDVRCQSKESICKVTVSTLFDEREEKTGYVAFVYDKTEQYLTTNKLQASIKTAMEASKAKSDFLANMSHEIRTPINTILGMNEMILRETRDKSLVKYASDIRTAGGNLLNIVSDILDFSKIEAGNMEIDPTTYDTKKLLFDVVSVMTFRAKEKGLKFIQDIDPKLPKKLIGDDVRVKQVLNNLLSNAIKYTSKGRIILRIIASRIDDETCDIQIAVTDTGCGIAKDDIPNLFEPFTRFDENKNRTIEGTGLGLKITKEIISKMNGVINVKSTYGRGSTFSCSFKQGIAESGYIGDFERYYESHQNQVYAYHKAFEAPNCSVLVVDDNQMNLSVIENLLKDTGINVVTVLSGQAALESTKSNRYDLILMDHMMPQMDGIETFERIVSDPTNLNKNTPVVAVTANAIKGAKEMYLSKGFSDYVAKPVDFARLEGILIKYLPANKVSFVNTSVEDLARDEDQQYKEKLKLAEKYLEKKNINVVTGLKNVGSNLEAYNDALASFVKSDAIDKLQMLLEKAGKEPEKIEEISRNYGLEAYGIKTSAKTIGATNLSSIAYNHEMAGREYRLDTAKEEFANLSNEWNNVKAIIEEYLFQVELQRGDDKEENLGLKIISPEELNGKLITIRNYAKDFEHVAAKYKIEELMDYRLDENTLRVIKGVYRCLESIDYNGAINLLKEIIKDE